MPQPIYHHYENEARVIVLGCETCGSPVVPEYRNQHTLWHRYIDMIAKNAGVSYTREEVVSNG